MQCDCRKKSSGGVKVVGSSDKLIINEVFTDAQRCFCRWDSDEGVAWHCHRDRDGQAGNGQEAGLAAQRDADDAAAAGGEGGARLPAAVGADAAPGLELPLMEEGTLRGRVRAWPHG